MSNQNQTTKTVSLAYRHMAPTETMSSGDDLIEAKAFCQILPIKHYNFTCILNKILFKLTMDQSVREHVTSF